METTDKPASPFFLQPQSEPMSENTHQDGIYPFPAVMQTRAIETNHWIMEEQPEATTKLVVDFLRRHSQ